MKNTLLKSLLKAKNNQKEEVEALIEAYIRDAKNVNKKETQVFVSELLVFVMGKVEEEIETSLLLQMVQTKVNSLGYSIQTQALEVIHEKAAKVVATSVGVVFSFDKTDTEVLDSMYRALTWMREDGAANTQDKLKSIIAEAMEGNLSYTDLGETLRQEFQDVIDGSAEYFKGVSDHVIRQSNAVTRAYQYEKAGVTEVQIVAVIDGRTSDICKSMHGRIIQLSVMKDQADAIQQATSIEEKKNVSRWQSKPIFGKLPKDVAMPPYHFRCRTTYMAYFRQSEEIDGKNVNGSLLPGETWQGNEVLFSHQDKFGYERVVTDRLYHESKSPKPSLKHIRAGFEDLSHLAIHGDDPTKTIGWSSKQKLFLVFQKNELVTAFEPRDKKSYFTRVAGSNLIESLSKSKGKDDE